LKKYYFENKIEELRKKIERSDGVEADKLMLELQDLVREKGSL
jgi:hypothetical protein